ncbi:hypothetical protein E8E13_003225 [Curvularia kusanoi]|uniref:Uncharacterized protein n=1 Tax=Curvularia kusanoi TaxID=90978 RepID=A0A9P4TBA7_CURKU|nr:hypothetical protein E8E13_003225 [Curvularia kusanoi]
MDSGMALGVVNPYHREAEGQVVSPEPALELPPGFLEKPHVRHALKYMDTDEQRETTLKVALAWKEKFATEQWKSVLTAIEHAKKEDSVRSSPQDEVFGDIRPTPSWLKRPRAATATSTPGVPNPLTASLPSCGTSAKITPWPRRWDLVTSGPVTPLSAVRIGNSFSSGGFWSMSGEPQPQPHETIEQVAPVDPEPESPIGFQDPEARQIHTRLKSDVDKLARKLCLARYNTEVAGMDDYVPNSLIKPSDVEEAAQMILYGCKVELKDMIVTDLPLKLRRWAMDEAKLRSQLIVKDEADLRLQNDWMNSEALGTIPETLDAKSYNPPPTDLVLSILDEQREALRIFRLERDAALRMKDPARDSAWAVRILEDAERRVESEADLWSNDSGDDGYNYTNFLRSIKSEMSASASSEALSLMVEELSNFETTSFRFPSEPNLSSTIGSHESHRSDISSTISSEGLNTPIRRRPSLHVVTDIANQASPGQLSPEDRESRHRGPGLADLNHWAEELKRMDAVRAEQKRLRALQQSQISSHENKRDLLLIRPPTKQTAFGVAASQTSSADIIYRQSSDPSSPPNPDSSGPSPRTLYAQSISRSTSLLEPGCRLVDTRNASTPTPSQRTSGISWNHSLRRLRHQRTTSTATAYNVGITTTDENEWMAELVGMESRERSRQADERNREGDDRNDAFKALEGDE